MRLLALLWSTSRGRFLTSLFASILSGVANAGIVAAIHYGLSRRAPTPNFIVIALALCILAPLTRALSQGLLVRLGHEATERLVMLLSRRILAAPLARLETIGAGRLLAALTDDVAAITAGFAAILAIGLGAGVLLCCLVYIGWLSAKVLMGALALLGFALLTARFADAIAVRQMRLARVARDKLFDAFRAVTHAAKELKLHRGRREAFFSELYTPSIKAFRRHDYSANRSYILAGMWQQLLFFTSVILLLFYFPAAARGTDNRVGYALILLYMMSPIMVILTMAPAIGRGLVSLRKLDDLGLALSQDPDELALKPAATKPNWSVLKLEQIVHRYRSADDTVSFTLGPLDLEVRRGELLFVTGGNGSGKTTLAKLILGLYKPTAGRILLDSEPALDKGLDSFREHFSAVFSDAYVFDRLLGIEGPNLDGRAQELLALLQMDKAVSIRQGALSTTAVSQGQRKRLALLTAYMEDREVYVFDEWAADQDPHFKEIFYFDLLRALRERGKTVIVISHDDRYFKVADRVVKLDSGRIQSSDPDQGTSSASAPEPGSADAVPSNVSA